jgi:hypothetical protein
MAKRPPDPELVAETLALIDAGVSLREAAEVAGVSEGAIRIWKKKREQRRASEPAPAPAVPSHMAPQTPVAPAVEVGDDIVRLLKDMLSKTLQQSTSAEAVGNFTAAQRAGRDAGQLATVLARVTKLEAADSDVVRISMSEAKQIRAQLFERFAALLERPILCPECNRKLSVRWGTEGLVEADEHDPGAGGKSR